MPGPGERKKNSSYTPKLSNKNEHWQIKEEWQKERKYLNKLLIGTKTAVNQV